MKRHLFGCYVLLWATLIFHSVPSGGDQSKLKFNLSENGGTALPETLTYEMTKGHLVKLGELDFDLDRIAPSLGPQIEAASALYALRFAWPNKSILSGNLSIRDYDSDELIFQTSLSLIETPSAVKHINAPEEQVPLDTILNKKGERTLKFCIESLNQDLHTTLCSRPYILALKRNDYIFFEIEKAYSPNVLYNGNSVGLSGEQELLQDRPSVIVIQSQNGSTIKTEVSQTKSSFDSAYVGNDSHIIIEGHGTLPAKNILTSDRVAWRANLDSQESCLYFVEPNGFFICQPFRFAKKLPPEDAETYLDPKSPNETYGSQVLLHGHTTHGLTASSEHFKVKTLQDNKFQWDFQSDQRLQDNDQRITFTDASKESFNGSYSIYRGLPYEVSANGAIAFSDSYTIPVFGELTGTAWFEQIFKFESPTWSVHRWGVHVDGLTTIINAPNQYGHQVGFSSLEGDIRYTLTPGLWNHDEMYGPLINYQLVSFSAASGALMGVGVFWNRQLPKVLDRVSLFKYPKWFELQGNYYLMPGNSNTAMGTNFDLLVDLKIFFKATLFAKGGLEYRSFNFIDQTQFVLVQTSPFLLSLGAGITF